MAEKRLERNRMIAYGAVVSEPVFDHTTDGKNFYKMQLDTVRPSGTHDILNVSIAERKLDHDKLHAGALVKITGQFRSRNYKDESGKRRIDLYLFVSELELIDKLPEKEANSRITVRGYICKKPVYRTTPSGKRITDVMLAVSRPSGDSDYIPCILWGDHARIVKSFEPGVGLSLTGYVQARNYTTSKGKKGTAYELCVTRIANVISAAEKKAEEKKTVPKKDLEKEPESAKILSEQETA